MKILKNVLGILLIGLLGLEGIVKAQDTGSQIFLYEGQLLRSDGLAYTGTFNFRFSLWNNSDFYAGTDITPAYAINMEQDDYLGWQELKSIAIGSDGKFSIKLGESNPFDNNLFTQSELYLQIEVKGAASPDSAYEIIDSDGSNSLKDRMMFATVAFAKNANLLDGHDAGFNPGDIPYLDENGVFDGNTISGTAKTEFVLDSGNAALAEESISLKFGQVLSKVFEWNGLLQKFILNDSLEVQGDVEVTGDLTTTGTINAVTIGKYTKTEILEPAYKGGIFNPDGSNNSGSMYEELGDLGNSIRWSTKKTETQDYDIIIRYPLPEKFDSFESTNQFELEYKTSGDQTQSDLDFTLQREGDVVVDEFSGSGLSLSSNAWNTQSFTLGDTSKWTSGDTALLKIRMNSKKDYDSQIGKIKIKYVSE